ncbi:MAG: hypothetical protein HYY13_10655 [Nitrospirae bacterium]|nr:hypothetical protein [Nitrospirota bacterium]
MRLWSKGLGSKYILPLNLREADVATASDGVVLTGIIPVRKVRWWYKMALTEDDMIRFVRFVNQRDVRTFLARHGGAELWLRVVKDSLKFVGYFVKAWLTRPTSVPDDVSRGRSLKAES